MLWSLKQSHKQNRDEFNLPEEFWSAIFLNSRLLGESSGVELASLVRRNDESWLGCERRAPRLSSGSVQICSGWRLQVRSVGPNCEPEQQQARTHQAEIIFYYYCCLSRRVEFTYRAQQTHQLISSRCQVNNKPLPFELTSLFLCSSEQSQTEIQWDETSSSLGFWSLCSEFKFFFGRIQMSWR